MKDVLLFGKRRERPFFVRAATAKKEKRLLVAATVYHTDSLGPLQASLAGGARLYPSPETNLGKGD